MSIQQHYIDDRFKQLEKLIVEYGKLAWQFLMAVNGGGAVAILTLIGAVTSLRSSMWMYLSLIGYIIGLSLVGIAIAQQVLRFQYLQSEWVKNSFDFFNGTLVWEKLIKDDEVRTKNHSYIPWILGVASLLTFLATTIFSAVMLALTPLGS